MTPLLSIKNLNKTLNNFQFGPIDLTIEPGTITALVGNNGSGKSTLLKLIMQLIKPDSGSIQLANEKVTNTSDKWKQYVAYQRSEERRVGKECRTGGAREHGEAQE